MNFCKQTIHPPEALQLQQQKESQSSFVGQSVFSRILLSGKSCLLITAQLQIV